MFDSLFPMPSQEFLPVTKAAFTVVPAVKRTYDPSSIPCCPACGSNRVFECQLMPNLINIIKEKDVEDRDLTDEQRIKVVRAQDGRGMEWGTCMIFSCEKDCCLGDEPQECWREEYVVVQWDE